ncbi:hypothetical protein XJ44_02930 [Thermosipho affectus]|uniref:Competence protein ComGF n=1 Tax=Thermosipho affectus TaxID=660294 RepID=A0ABX3IID9_9BACT|nr:hypothetical protein [Thermosipho affectus]ONN27590.1 hypothetical protein XJ44_02930 [Thermosipho affectus]
MSFSISGIISFLLIFVILFATVLSLFLLLTKNLEVTFKNCSLEQCTIYSFYTLQHFFKNANVSYGVKVLENEISFIVSTPDGKGKEYKYILESDNTEKVIKLFDGKKYYKIVSIPGVISVKFSVRENLPTVEFSFGKHKSKFILTSDIST